MFLDNVSSVDSALCRVFILKIKNDFQSGGMFYGLFLSPNTKFYSTINKYGSFEEYETFIGFNDSKRLLDRSQYFKMVEGKRISAMLPRSWKKSFSSEIIIPTKMRFCNECNAKILCARCDNQINECKKLEANSNQLKRQIPNQFGYLLPYYIIHYVLKKDDVQNYGQDFEMVC